MKKETLTVEIYDDDHIWVKNRQYVSLERFLIAKKEMVDEVEALNDKLAKLRETTKALGTLLGVDA